MHFTASEELGRAASDRPLSTSPRWLRRMMVEAGEAAEHALQSGTGGQRPGSLGPGTGWSGYVEESGRVVRVQLM